MHSASFVLEDESLPRTVYWELFRATVEQLPCFSEKCDNVVIPAEDLAAESNWPRFGRQASAYVRGDTHDYSRDGPVVRYLFKVAEFARAHPDKIVLVVNMHPFARIPLQFRTLKNVVVADGCLAELERALNPNTISLPALPIVTENAETRRAAGQRTILASFQGVNSHPVRRALAAIGDGGRIVVNLVPRENYVGKLDAASKQGDPTYEALLANSVFAFVPRGDALFSYRLLEVMSFGCIPIILSDGWVLPFDRTIDWYRCSIRVHADAIERIPHILQDFSKDEISARQEAVRQVYQDKLSSLTAIVKTLLGELELFNSRRAG